MLFTDLWRANQITNKGKSSQRDTAQLLGHQNRHTEKSASGLLVWGRFGEGGKGEVTSKTPIFFLIHLLNAVNKEI